MPTRYEDAPREVLDIVNAVRHRYFPELINVKINVLFDLKKRSSRGKLTLGRIQKTNDLTKHLSRNEATAEDGYDFILYLDKIVFNNIDDKDKERLLRHQLRHIFVDPETPKNPYRIVGHDVEDFFMELELNKDDLRWAERVEEVALSIYELEKENEKDLPME